ncbi:MAG: prepilin-type N-terminal cleavage/methylation domain-containing protein [bacterium]|nr:prepilin-type N-terminal cleavage/methylation domain-containing protein [bacterium]
MAKRSGFTLIEVMIAIVIVGIIVGMAVPYVNSTQAKYNNTINNLIDKLNMARQEAITRNLTTTFYIDADSFFYGSDKFVYDTRIEAVVYNADGEEISFENPILFNAGGTTPKLVVFEISGFDKLTRIYLMPSGYILKSNETE